MAFDMFQFGILIKAIDQASAPIKRVREQLERVNAAAKKTAPLREAAENMAMVGAAAVGMGGALALGLKAMVEPAMKMQGEWAHVATAVSDGTKTLENLNQARELSEKLAVKTGMSEEALADSYYIARSNMLSHADALAAVAAATNLTIGTTKNATDAIAAQAATTRTLTTLHEVLGGTLGQNADMLAKLQSAYSFSDITEVNNALANVMPAAKMAGVIPAQAMSALAIISRGGLHGERAGIAFEEVLNKMVNSEQFAPFVRKTKEGGLDLIATFQAVNQACAGDEPDRVRPLGQVAWFQ